MYKKKVENGVYEYLFKNAPIDLINKLRKIIITAIPVWAIDYIQIYENTTKFNDDFICQILSLLPIYVEHSNNDEEVTGVINIDGDKDWCVTPEKLFEGTKIRYIDFLVSNKFPIFYISKGEKIELKLVARKGTMDEHSKWQSSWTYLKSNIKYEPCDFSNVQKYLSLFYNKLFDKYTSYNKDSTVYKHSILVIEQRNIYTPDQMLHFAMIWLYKCINENNIEYNNMLSSISGIKNL